MDIARFFDAVVRTAPFDCRETADRAVTIVLDELGASLDRGDRAAVAGELPPEFAAMLGTGRGGRPTASGFFADVARGENTNLGFAREHIAVILRSLCEQLSFETVGRLRRGLPPEIAEMTAGKQHSEPPAPPRHGHSLSSAGPSTRSVSTARPGSTRPIVEARIGDKEGEP